MKPVIALSSLALFLIQVILAPFAEATIWDERRAVQMASLPPSLSLPSLHKPEILPVSTLPSLGKDKMAILSRLPQRYGTFRRLSQPVQKRTDQIVIHIQDIHSNPEAQKNISLAIQALVQTGQVDLVGFEGAFEPFDFSRYQSFPHTKAIQVAADYLLKTDQVSGAFHAGLVSSSPFPFAVGLDHKGHYEANVQAFRDSRDDVEIRKTAWEKTQAALQKEKKLIFSPRLLEFDQSVQAYRDGKIPFGAYVRMLSAFRGESFRPEIEIFLQALSLEDKLNLDQVNRERNQFLSSLVPTLTKEQMDHLTNWSLSYRAGHLSHATFYEMLKTLCHDAGLHLDRFPNLNAYVQYVLLSDKINGDRLFREIQMMELEAFDRLAVTEDEKKKVKADRRHYLEGKLLAFSLTPQEWEEYKKREKGEGRRDQGNSFIYFEKFYQQAEVRDRAIAGNLLGAMRKQQAKMAVLVAGGFHSQGIERQLVKQGITVVQFVPKVTKLKENDGASYLSVFTQQKTPLEELFQGETLFLAKSPATPYVTRFALPNLALAAYEQFTAGQTTAEADRTFVAELGSDGLKNNYQSVSTQFGPRQVDVVSTLKRGKQILMRVFFGPSNEIMSTQFRLRLLAEDVAIVTLHMIAMMTSNYWLSYIGFISFVLIHMRNLPHALVKVKVDMSNPVAVQRAVIKYVGSNILFSTLLFSALTLPVIISSPFLSMAVFLLISSMHAHLDVWVFNQLGRSVVLSPMAMVWEDFDVDSRFRAVPKFLGGEEERIRLVQQKAGDLFDSLKKFVVSEDKTKNPAWMETWSHVSSEDPILNGREIDLSAYNSDFGNVRIYSDELGDYFYFSGNNVKAMIPSDYSEDYLHISEIITEIGSLVRGNEYELVEIEPRWLQENLLNSHAWWEGESWSGTGRWKEHYLDYQHIYHRAVTIFLMELVSAMNVKKLHVLDVAGGDGAFIETFYRTFHRRHPRIKVKFSLVDFIKDNLGSRLDKARAATNVKNSDLRTENLSKVINQPVDIITVIGLLTRVPFDQEKSLRVLNSISELLGAKGVFVATGLNSPTINSHDLVDRGFHVHNKVIPIKRHGAPNHFYVASKGWFPGSFLFALLLRIVSNPTPNQLKWFKTFGLVWVILIESPALLAMAIWLGPFVTLIFLNVFSAVHVILENSVLDKETRFERFIFRLGLFLPYIIISLLPPSSPFVIVILSVIGGYLWHILADSWILFRSKLFLIENPVEDPAIRLSRLLSLTLDKEERYVKEIQNLFRRRLGTRLSFVDVLSNDDSEGEPVKTLQINVAEAERDMGTYLVSVNAEMTVLRLHADIDIIKYAQHVQEERIKTYNQFKLANGDKRGFIPFVHSQKELPRPNWNEAEDLILQGILIPILEGDEDDKEAELKMRLVGIPKKNYTELVKNLRQADAGNLIVSGSYAQVTLSEGKAMWIPADFLREQVARGNIAVLWSKDGSIKELVAIDPSGLHVEKGNGTLVSNSLLYFYLLWRNPNPTPEQLEKYQHWGMLWVLFVEIPGLVLAGGFMGPIPVAILIFVLSLAHVGLVRGSPWIRFFGHVLFFLPYLLLPFVQFDPFLFFIAAAFAGSVHVVHDKRVMKNHSQTISELIPEAQKLGLRDRFDEKTNENGDDSDDSSSIPLPSAFPLLQQRMGNSRLFGSQV